MIAPEASNNAKEGGHLITTIAFGVPSGASMAVLLSAFLMHGLVPGPEMLTKNLDITFLIVWSLTLAHVIGGLICLAASGMFARLAAVPPGKMVPVVLAVMFLSAFQGSQSWGDLYVLVIIGTVGWLMKLLDWPRPPLLLGFVLGGIFERNLFISTEIYSWGWLYRPVVLGILALTIWSIQAPLRESAKGIIRTFRTSRGSPKVGINLAVIFNVAILAVVGAALWQASGWPWEDALVPRTAAYIVLFFGTLNLVVELFFAGLPEQTAPAIHDGPLTLAAAMHDKAAIRRSFAHFAWMIAFLVMAYGIGLLPGVFMLILLYSRFEFREGWFTASVSAVAVSIIAWILFDNIFSLVWPQSVLAQLFPALHASFNFI